MKGLYDLVVAYGDDPYRMTVQAIQAIGGMKKFVKKNSVVVIKPNIGWDRTPEQAANTNPQVVAALVELCYQAQVPGALMYSTIPATIPADATKTAALKKQQRIKAPKSSFPMTGMW